MAKLFVFLLGVLVILNGMTFLLVWNQGSLSEKSEAATNTPASTAANPTAGAKGVSSPEAQRLEMKLEGISKSVSELSRKLDDVQRKVALTSSRAPAANFQAPAGPAAVGAAGTRSPAAPPAARTGEVDYSRLPNVRGGRQVGAAHVADDDAEGGDEASRPSKARSGASATGQPQVPAGVTGAESSAGGANGESPPHEAGSGDGSSPAQPQKQPAPEGGGSESGASEGGGGSESGGGSEKG